MRGCHHGSSGGVGVGVGVDVVRHAPRGPTLGTPLGTLLGTPPGHGLEREQVLGGQTEECAYGSASQNTAALL